MSDSDIDLPCLQLLDERRRAQHCFLQPEDRCHYLWDYRPGRPRTRQEQWIANLKCRPSQAAACPTRGIYKERAICRAAEALRAAAPRAWVEEASWCPIPPSAKLDDADYDDRLLRVLYAAFEGYDADIRLLLRQSQTTPADHRESRRLSFAALYSLTAVDTRLLAERSLRRQLVLFDDLLTTGKHFKCAQARLGEVVGPIPVSACFLARRVLAPGRCGLAANSTGIMENDAVATAVGQR